MENKLTPELLEKAKQAKTAEELAALAKENGVELTAESVKACFDSLNKAGELSEDELKAFLDSKENKTGELADDELDQVAGGRKCGTLYEDDGSPIITVLNSCEYYQNENTWKKDDGDGYCRSCRYSKDVGVLLCKCPMRKFN